ncbi:MAG: amidohydrolase family protein [Deltaproteobacteria bacterium]|nr:amidohydrolase family protein [Deltaproteobacteria bacterium]
MASAKGGLCLLARGLAGAESYEGPPAVLVREGRVAALGAQALAQADEQQELKDLWLSPAPLDAHVHLYLGPGPEQAMQAWREAGVAAVRDLGHKPHHPTPRDNGGSPLLRNACVGLGAQGEAAYWLAAPLSGAQAFAQAAREQAHRGAAVIKLFASGLLDFQHAGGVCHPQALTPGEVAAAVREAHAAGLPVTVHANGEKAVSQALAQGVDGIEHGYFLGSGCLLSMAQKGVWWTPTLAAVLAHLADPDARHDQATLEALAEIARRQAAQIRLGEELGVNLVLGSDAGSYNLPHGEAVFREMAAWLEAGVSPATVFEAATTRAARSMGLAGELGRIAVGARAWFLGTTEDPRLTPLQWQKPAWRNF